MDNPLGSSDFDRGEMIPPVPAPRYKRKLITNEDSKHRSNKQNTSVSEWSANIMPPPRRKNKSHKFLVTKSLPLKLKDQENTAFPKKIEKGNRVNHKLNSNAETEDRETSSDQKLTACQVNIILEKSIVTTDLSQIVSSDHENCHKKSVLESHVELDKSLNILDNIPSNELEMSPVFGGRKESHIFEKFLDDRVLDNPLAGNEESVISFVEQKSPIHYFDINENRDENRVNSSFSENSATIVGVFLKPEYSLLNKDKFENQVIVNEPGSDFGMCLRVDDGNKTNASVPIYDHIKVSNKITPKDSEEVDSGVYFSDTKSPSHLGNRNEHFQEKSKTTNKEKDLEFYQPFSCNNGDTFDNKSSEDLETQNYTKMLDYFEAQTVTAFHEEITSRLSLCSGQINKNKVVEDWLDSGEYLSKKKNSSFSEYLRNMLETSSSVGTMSPYDLSAVDEDDKSDSFSDDLMGCKKIDEVSKRESVPKACAVPSSLTNIHENIFLAPRNNIDFIVDMNSVNKQNVNIDCNKVTPKENKPANVYDNFNNTDDFNQYCQKSCFIEEAFESSNCHVQFVIENDQSSIENIGFGKDDVTNRDELCVQKTDHFVPSPSIKHGAVNSLIAFFETVHKQEFISVCEDEILFEMDDNIVNTSDFKEIVEEIKNEKISSSNLLLYPKEDTFENTEKILALRNTKSFFNLEKSLHNQESTNIISVETALDSSEAKQDNTLTNITVRDRDSRKSISILANDLVEENVKSDIINESTTIGQGLMIETTPLCIPGSNIAYDNVDLFLTRTTVEEEVCSPTANRAEIDISQSVVNNINTNESIINNVIDFSNSSCKKQIMGEDIDQFRVVPSECLPSLYVHQERFYETKVKKSDNYKSSSLYNDGLTGTSGPISSSFYKPTRIPVVILTEADIRSSPIGSIELHSSGRVSPDHKIDSSDESNKLNSNENVTAFIDTGGLNDNMLLENTIGVVLEKNWGSIGLKIKGDEQGVIVSDLLAEGAADHSGLVFKGWIDIKEMPEEMEIFC